MLWPIALIGCLVAGQAHAAMPYYGWLQFDFPGHTSLHDCPWLEPSEADGRSVCSDILAARLAMSQEDDLDPATRKQLGHFGEQPLFFVHATVLHCAGDTCEEQESVRAGPPDAHWSAPVVQNLGSHLLYHMPSHQHRFTHRLRITGLTGDWLSEPFRSPFRNNYLDVRFDAEHPGVLQVEMNWKRCLTDPANAKRLLDDAQDMLLVWMILTLLAAPVATAMAASRHFGRRVALRAWLAHGGILLGLLSLTFLPAWSNALSLISLPLLYVATLPLDARFIRQGSEMSLKQAMLPALVLRAGTILLLVAGAWLLSL